LQKLEKLPARPRKRNTPLLPPGNETLNALTSVLTFKEIKHLLDYRTVGLSDCRIIGRTPFSPGFLGFFCVQIFRRGNAQRINQWKAKRNETVGDSIN
jgi:hypothetical protein